MTESVSQSSYYPYHSLIESVSQSSYYPYQVGSHRSTAYRTLPQARLEGEGNGANAPCVASYPSPPPRELGGDGDPDPRGVPEAELFD